MKQFSINRLSNVILEGTSIVDQAALLVGNLWASLGDHTGAYKTILLLAHVLAVTTRYGIGESSHTRIAYRISQERPRRGLLSIQIEHYPGSCTKSLGAAHACEEGE